MTKTISPALNQKINNRFGIEFTYQVDIYWEPSEPTSYIGKYIVDITDITVSTESNIPGADFTCTVTLADETGDLKYLYDNSDLVNKKAKVYLLFTDTSEKVLIGTGYLVSPIIYKDGTLQLNVYSGLVDHEVGFSTEDLEERHLDEDIKTWPMIFGKVCGAEAATLVRSPEEGTLVADEGIMDYTLPARICQVQKIQCPVYQTGGQFTNVPKAGISVSGVAKADGVYWSDRPMRVVDQTCAADRRREYCRLAALMAEQKATEHPTMTITDGDRFPQGTKIELDIDGGIFTGVFSGNTFTIQQRKHPLYDIIGPVTCDNIPGFSMSYVNPDEDYKCSVNVPDEYLYQNELFVKGNADLQALLDYCGGSTHLDALREDMPVTHSNINRFREIYPPDSTWTPGASNWTIAGSANRIIDSMAMGAALKKPVGGEAESRTRYYQMPNLGGFVAQAGSVVKNNSTDYVYVVSIIPGTVLKVSAYKSTGYGHASTLVTLPSDYYTIEEVDFGRPYKVVEIHMKKRPQDIDPCLENDLYVDFQSDFGTNPVDIIKWLIETYTDLEVNSISFNDVRNKLEKYPIGFIVKDRPKVMDLVKDIAFQARCVLYIYDETIYIKYFSEAPTTVGIIGDSDIYQDTLVESYETDFATSYTIEWDGGIAQPIRDSKDTKTFTLEHYIWKYGLQKRNDHYYTIQNRELAEKTATFWLIRFSNLWKTVTFEGPLSLFRYLIYEAVMFNGVRAIITEQAATDTGVKVKLWLPIRLGENKEYFWAWPAYKPPWSNLALDTSITQGREVMPPASHILSKGPLKETLGVLGDQFPSDLDDDYLEIDCRNNSQSIDSIPCDNIGGEGYDRQFDKFAIGEGANAGNPPENKPGNYTYPGTCWWRYTVFVATCEYVYCFAETGPCEHMKCGSSMLCCRFAGSGVDVLTCVTKFFSDCGAAYSSWVRDRSEKYAPWSNGLTKIHDILPREADNCYDLPHKLHKEPNPPGEDSRGIYRDCYHLDDGRCVPRNYYCNGPQADYVQVPDICTKEEADAYQSENLDRPEVSSDFGTDKTNGDLTSMNVCDQWLPPGTKVSFPSGSEYRDPGQYLTDHKATEPDTPEAIPDDDSGNWWSFNTAPPGSW